MQPLKFTEEKRQELLKRGEESLAFFSISLLGLDAPDRKGNSQICDFHLEYCSFLEGRHPFRPWNRAVVCAFRGSSKSTFGTMSYPMWRCIYIPDFSAKLIENSYENCQRHHFLPLQEIFQSSKRADFLQWLYQDRIPAGFAGWNSDQIDFVHENPPAYPSLSYWGVGSRFEGAHPDLLVLDDVEGADADANVAHNQSSWATYQRCIPLLKSQQDGQILVIGTPWGDNPLVYQLKDRPDFEVYWREILDENGNCRWPERFPPHVIESLRLEDSWDTQYMLRRRSSRNTIFLAEAVDDSLYERDHLLLKYKGFEFDPASMDDLGFNKPKQVEAAVPMHSLLTYVHVDPLHRTEDQIKTKRKGDRGRPAEAAITVVGIAPDYHAFVLDTWAKSAALDELAREVFRRYCMFAAITVTFEAVGAQMWFRTFIETLEKQDPRWAHPKCPGQIMPPCDLPKMSSRLVEGEKGPLTKEYLWRERLAPWINHRILHLHRSQEKLRHQLLHVMDETVAVDLVDSLAQGAGRDDKGRAIWRAPMGREGEDRLRARKRYVEMKARPITGYYSPWSTR